MPCVPEMGSTTVSLTCENIKIDKNYVVKLIFLSAIINKVLSTHTDCHISCKYFLFASINKLAFLFSDPTHQHVTILKHYIAI